jgi:hypothetical protein
MGTGLFSGSRFLCWPAGIALAEVFRPQGVFRIQDVPVLSGLVHRRRGFLRVDELDRFSRVPANRRRGLGPFPGQNLRPRINRPATPSSPGVFRRVQRARRKSQLRPLVLDVYAGVASASRPRGALGIAMDGGPDPRRFAGRDDRRPGSRDVRPSRRENRGPSRAIFAFPDQHGGHPNDAHRHGSVSRALHVGNDPSPEHLPAGFRSDIGRSLEHGIAVPSIHGPGRGLAHRYRGLPSAATGLGGAPGTWVGSGPGLGGIGDDRRLAVCDYRRSPEVRLSGGNERPPSPGLRGGFYAFEGEGIYGTPRSNRQPATPWMADPGTMAGPASVSSRPCQGQRNLAPRPSSGTARGICVLLVLRMGDPRTLRLRGHAHASGVGRPGVGYSGRRRDMDPRNRQTVCGRPSSDLGDFL